MSGRKVVFIINPKAGTHNKKGIDEIIKATLSAKLNYDILYWESPKQDVSSVAANAVQGGAGIVAAVGGDGTVNAVAKGLIGTQTALAIIPMGSGNGLARHLGIPINVEKAIQLLASGKITAIDSCQINGRHFFCTSGIGFDAHIGRLFAQVKKRGFVTYARLTLRELISYKPQEYTLEVDGKNVHTKAFLITFANSNQWGNNAFIAPMADISDGNIEVCILKPFSMLNVPGIANKLFGKKISSSSFYEHYSGKQIRVTRHSPGPVHYDGEPDDMGISLSISNASRTLRVLVP